MGCRKLYRFKVGSIHHTEFPRNDHFLMILFVRRKWKCGKTSCLAVSPDGKSLVAAKTEIKWWDISGEKEVLRKTFNGHATDVVILNFVEICGESCILSAATDDRFINAW